MPILDAEIQVRSQDVRAISVVRGGLVGGGGLWVWNSKILEYELRPQACMLVREHWNMCRGEEPAGVGQQQRWDNIDQFLVQVILGDG